MCANAELFIDAVAGGERSFMRMLSKREVVGRDLLDHVLYPLTAEQENKCRGCEPSVQDFDAAYRGLNIISKDVVKCIKTHMETGYPNAAVISLAEYPVMPTYRYRHATFFKVLDYKRQSKYRMLPKMAAVKMCGRLYVALNAVNVRVDAPIIVTSV
jgi:hypothetical protein